MKKLDMLREMFDGLPEIYKLPIVVNSEFFEAVCGELKELWGWRIDVPSTRLMKERGVGLYGVRIFPSEFRKESDK